MWNILDKKGIVIQRTSCPEEEAKLLVSDGGRVLWSEGTPDWFDVDTPKYRGAAPSKYHVFDYTTKKWIDPRTPATEWPIVRAERDRRLQASDWTQLPDVPLATKEAWAIYRQALRDITLQPDPFNIVWPAVPG